jgi:FecR protein
VKDELSRPEIEELSDLQWARIERGLWQRMDVAPAESDAPEAEPSRRVRGAPPWRWRALALGTALAAAAVLLFTLWPGRGGSEDDEGASTGVATHDRTDEPSRVVTRDSATTVSFADAAIEVQPRSALLLSGSRERGATIVLERGRAGFHVAPRQAQRPFVVVAGDVMVRVVGTRFEVARMGEDVTVEVQEGVVDVRYLGQVHQVISGAQWRSPPVKAATATATLIDAGDAGDASAAAPRGPDAPGIAEPTRAPARPRAPREEPPAAPPTPAPAETSTLAAEFAAAAALESSSPQQALSRYLALAKRGDRWGRNALFAAARLALDVGERARAGELARSYLRRFPDGPNAPDAQALLDSLP